MNTFPESIDEELDTLPPSHLTHTAAEIGAEAATRYLGSHPKDGPKKAKEPESSLRKNASFAVPVAFFLGLLLGRMVKF